MDQHIRIGPGELLRAERDPEFVALLGALTARGLRVAGMVGIGLVFAYLFSQLVRGRPFAWASTSGHTIALWDKAAIVAFALSGILGSKTQFGQKWGRLWVALSCLAAALVSVLDDTSRPDTSFSTPWIATALFVAVTTVPFSPWQAILLGLSGIAVYVVPVASQGLYVSAPQLLFIVMFGLLAAAISTLLYRTRWELFKSVRQAEHLAEESKQKTEEVRRLERMKSRFFLGISHDLRTPLSLIVGPVGDVLAGAAGELPEKAAHLLELARSGVGQLDTYVSDLLDLARLDVDELPLAFDSYDLAELARDVVLSHQPLAERASIDLVMEDVSTPAPARIDATRVRQVLTNLLTNAIKYAGPDGRVRVSVSQNEAEAVLEVRDNGPGISPDDRAHIFERFYRSPQAHGAGLGVGLSIAAEIVSMHGGTLDVESELGFGSLFRMAVPLSNEPVLPLPSTEDLEPEHHEFDEGREPEQGPGPRPEVLVVDDNAHLRAYLRSQLTGRYHVTEAQDGLEAWEWLQEHRPALVLSDVSMPRLDGIALCRRIRESASLADLPVILLTARGDEDSRLAGLRAGADDYLLKPFNGGELRARAENLIELRTLIRTAGHQAALVGPSTVSVASADEEFVTRARDVVERELENGNFGVDWLADELGISSRQLQRRMRDATGLSGAGFIRMLRLGRAAQLLAQQACNVSEAAYQVGFRDPDHFSKLFKQAYGMPPSQYAAELPTD